MAKKSETPDGGHVDPDIRYDGTALTLPLDPAKMPLRAAIEILKRKAEDAAIEILKRKAEDEETEMDVHEVIDAYPMDGAVAFVQVMRDKC